jgi:hypothetical protein
VTSKKLILVLLLILLLFAAVVGFGLSRDDSEPSAFEGTLKSLSASLVHKEPVSPLSISGSCFSGNRFVVAVGRTCSAEIGTSQTQIRTIKLMLAAGVKGKLQVEPRGSTGVPLDVEVPSNDTNNSRTVPEIQILKDGAGLNLTCEASAAPQPCIFTLNQ